MEGWAQLHHRRKAEPAPISHRPRLFSVLVTLSRDLLRSSPAVVAWDLCYLCQIPGNNFSSVAFADPRSPLLVVPQPIILFPQVRRVHHTVLSPSPTLVIGIIKAPGRPGPQQRIHTPAYSITPMTCCVGQTPGRVKA